MEMLSPQGYSFRKMGHFNLASHGSKVQLAPPIENIHRLKDDHADSKIGIPMELSYEQEKDVRKFFYKSLLNSAYL